jgi:hypothetical protein
MSLATVTQLHTDLGKLAQKNPEHFAEPAMIMVFNANLADAQARYPKDTVISATPEASGQVRINDLFIRVGQLKATLQSNQPTLFGST